VKSCSGIKALALQGRVETLFGNLDFSLSYLFLMLTSYPLKIHHPPHVYLDETIYFITVHIHDDLPIFSAQRKSELLNLIAELFKKYDYKLFTYAILNNHYHLLLKVLLSKYLSDIFQTLHGSLSYKWNKEDDLQGRIVFQNYWDYCIRDEKDFWTHFNYIHQNPIKHGVAKNLEELKNYPYWISTMGK